MVRLSLLWLPFYFFWPAFLPSTTSIEKMRNEMAIAEPLPPFRATTLDGRQVDSRALKGKVVVLNFWFIACKPCVMEMPELNALVESFKRDTNVIFLAPALDGASGLQAFLQKQDFRYQVIPSARSLAMIFNVNSYPTHLVTDKNGNVAYRSVGYSTISNGQEGTVDLLRKKIADLLKI